MKRELSDGKVPGYNYMYGRPGGVQPQQGQPATPTQGFMNVMPPLVDVDAMNELEMLNELPALMKKVIDSSPFAKDNVILSVRAQMLLDELRRVAPLNPFLFLHNNIRKFIKLRGGIILKLLPFKGYRLTFANNSRRFR